MLNVTLHTKQLIPKNRKHSVTRHQTVKTDTGRNYTKYLFYGCVLLGSYSAREECTKAATAMVRFRVYIKEMFSLVRSVQFN